MANQNIWNNFSHYRVYLSDYLLLYIGLSRHLHVEAWIFLGAYACFLLKSIQKETDVGPKNSSEKYSEENRRGPQEILTTRMQSGGLGIKYCLVNRPYPPYLTVWAKIKIVEDPEFRNVNKTQNHLGMHPV